jgi:hypothetical protein
VYKDKKASRGSTVVEHSSHHSKVEGSSQAATNADTERGKMAKNEFEVKNNWHREKKKNSAKSLIQ